MRDEGPTKGDMFGPVVEAILFREGNGRGAILIEGSGSCLRENQFVCKLAHIHCFLSGGGEGYNFALGGAECDKGGASGSSAHSAVDDENIAHARYRQSWRGRSHRCGQADAAVDKSERTIGEGCFEQRTVQGETES